MKSSSVNRRPSGNADGSSLNQPVRRRLWMASVPVAELLEKRTLLSSWAGFSGQMGTDINGVNTINEVPGGVSYTGYVTDTGSQSGSSTTFTWGDGNTSGPYTNFGGQHAGTNTYNPGGSTTYQPTDSFTPTGGSARTLPLTLDSGFGITPTFSGRSDSAAYGNTYSNGGGTATALDPNTGAIFVAAPYAATGSTPEFSVTKFTGSTGDVDQTWANHGTIAFNFDSSADIPYAIFDDGLDVYVAGKCGTGICVAAISLVNPPALDTAFNGTGLVSNIGQTGRINSITEETTPNTPSKTALVLAGTDGTQANIVVARIDTAGNLDTTFNGTGIKTINFGGTGAVANYVMKATFTQNIMSSNHDLLVAGHWKVNSNECASVIVALNDTDGSLDTSNFGYNWNGTSGAGYTYTEIGCVASAHSINGCCGAGKSHDSDYSLICWQDTGTMGSPWHIISVGVTDYTTDTSPCSNQFAFVNYDQHGVRNTSWGTQGIVAIGSGPAGPSSSATAFAGVGEGTGDTDPNLQIVAAGTGLAGTTGQDFVLTRIAASNGALDSHFGSSGQLNTDMTPTGVTTAATDSADAVFIDSDGTILVGGSTSYNSGQLALARYLPGNQLKVSVGGLAPHALGANLLLASAAADPAIRWDPWSTLIGGYADPLALHHRRHGIGPPPAAVT